MYKNLDGVDRARAFIAEHRTMAERRAFREPRAEAPPKSTTVYAEPGESIESLLRRFKKGVQSSGILTELRRRETHVKPSERRKDKSRRARVRGTPSPN